MLSYLTQVPLQPDKRDQVRKSLSFKCQMQTFATKDLGFDEYWIIHSKSEMSI